VFLIRRKKRGCLIKKKKMKCACVLCCVFCMCVCVCLMMRECDKRKEIVCVLTC
jgi:hypothetical protein